MGGLPKKSQSDVRSAKPENGVKTWYEYLNPRWPMQEPKWLTPEEAKRRYPWLSIPADQLTPSDADAESAS